MICAEVYRAISFAISFPISSETSVRLAKMSCAL
jgi:hypothetical protein